MTLFYSKTITKYIETLLKNSWPKVLNTQNRKRILYKSKMRNILIWIGIFNVYLTLILHCLNIYVFKYSNNQYTIQIFRNLDSEILKSSFTLLYCFTGFFFTYGMITPLIWIVYIITHIENQFALINDYIINNFMNRGLSDYDLPRNNAYQTRVNRKLRFCIQEHAKLKG